MLERDHSRINVLQKSYLELFNLAAGPCQNSRLKAPPPPKKKKRKLGDVILECSHIKKTAAHGLSLCKLNYLLLRLI